MKSKLHDVIIHEAPFLADMSAAAKENGIDDPVKHIQKVADLEPETVAKWAEQYDGVARFYAELGNLGRLEVQPLHKETWNGDTAVAFKEFFEDLCSHMSGGDQSLAAVTAATADQMRNTADLLLEWQNAIADVIKEQAKEWDGVVDGLYTSAFDIFSVDPLAALSGAAKLLVMSLVDVNSSYEYAATKGTSIAGTNVTYHPLNAERLAEVDFDSKVTDIPSRI